MCDTAAVNIKNNVTFSTKVVDGDDVQTARISTNGGNSGQFIVLTLRWTHKGIVNVGRGLRSMQIRDIVIDNDAANPTTEGYVTTVPGKVSLLFFV